MFTIGMTILQMELVTTNSLLTLVTSKAIGMVRLLQSIDTLPNNRLVADGTFRGEVGLVVLFTVQEATFFYKADVQQLHTTTGLGTNKMVRAPCFVHGHHKRTPDAVSTG